MTLKDLFDVIRICNQAFLEEARITSHIAPQLIKSLFEEPNAQFVAEANGKVIGFLRGTFNIKEKEAKVHHIAVHPNYQRMGIGTELMKHFENLAR